MARDDYRDGDRLDDGAGNVAWVRALKSRRDGSVYLKAVITSGPRRDARRASGQSGDEWIWPESFGRPTIDWTPNGAPTSTCHDCERAFRGGDDEHGMRRLFCRTCDARQQATTRRMSTHVDASHGFGVSNRPRQYGARKREG